MLRIKQIGTICFAIFSILISAPLFATGVSSGATSADCDNATLDTYSGTSNLQAGWQPNTIALHWYNGDTEITSGVQTSCVYDGALTPPTTIPTKTGYTFKGWRVRQATNLCFLGPVCGLTGAVAEIEGNDYWAKGTNNGNDVCYHHDGSVNCSDSTFASLNTNEWMVSFSHGVVKGVASCNNMPGGDGDTTLNSFTEQLMEQMEAGTLTLEQAQDQYDAFLSQRYSRVPGMCQPTGTFNSGSVGQYCWCHLESYTPNGGNTCNDATRAWVFIGGVDGTESGCARRCANNCSYVVATTDIEDSDVRNAVFGVSQ